MAARRLVVQVRNTGTPRSGVAVTHANPNTALPTTFRGDGGDFAVLRQPDDVDILYVRMEDSSNDADWIEILRTT